MLISAQAQRGRQSGFTLVEMMVAITAGLIVVAAGVAMLSSTFGSNSSALRMTRMNQDLRTILHAISYDITRAGGWSLAPLVTELTAAADLSLSAATGTVTATALRRGTTNTTYAGFNSPLNATTLNGRTLIMLMPNAAGVTTRYDLTVSAVASSSTLTLVIPAGVTLTGTKIRAGTWTLASPFSGITLSAGNDCILFSYDLNNNGVRDTSSEQFGYRFDATNNAIDATTSDTSCTTGSGWENITDEDVLTINQFTITQITTPLVAVGQLNTQVREYSVALGGRLKSDATAQRNLRNVASVRNHLVQ